MILVRSLNATVGVPVSDWTFFVNAFGWDVRVRFVFDVNDARFLVALQRQFLMTCGQHIVRQCSFCGTMTRAFPSYSVSKECLRQSVWAHILWRRGGRQRRPHSRCRSCAGLPYTSCSWGWGKGTEGRARSRKGGSRWTHMDGHGDDMKDTNLSLSQGACVKMKTQQHYLRECVRRSVDVFANVSIVKCHASIDVVIDVRIVECHASIDVVIDVRIVLCHPLVDFPIIWIFYIVPNSHLVVML